MDLVAISINHKTAPVEIREALHLEAEEIKTLLNDLKHSILREGFIISTCNRTEIYCIPQNPRTGFRELQKYLLDKRTVKGISSENFQNFFSCGAVSHLFKVGAGLDSLMVGDNQILGQVKEAFQLAEELQTTGFLSNKIIDAAIRVGKRVKTETFISDGASTVSYAAVQLIEKIYSNLNKKSALVIGTGETGQLAAKHIKDKGIGSLTVTNRTLEKAEKFAQSIHANILPFDYFKENLKDFDIVISATSSPEVILSYNEVAESMKLRSYDMTCFVDIAIPRDIDPKIKTLDNVFYHDIDSLKIIVDQNIKKRQAEIPKAQKIIMEEMIGFFSWYNSLEVTPTVVSLRNSFEKIRLEEIEKMKNKLNDADLEKIDLVTKRIVNKLLHTPTVELKKLSENGISSNETTQAVSFLRKLFGLQ